jgi:hypothetical protein
MGFGEGFAIQGSGRIPETRNEIRSLSLWQLVDLVNQLLDNVN